MEQWDAANPSIDRPILALCYLLGLADPGSSSFVPINTKKLFNWNTMSSSQTTNADKVSLEQGRRRKGRLFGGMMAAFFGLIAFFSVANSPRFETFHTLDVIRLMTAGAGLGVALVLVIWFFESRGSAPRM